MNKITVIGGGTGSYTVLQGLKNYDIDLTSIVSTADSGGSSGSLRDEFGVLPPGDLRRCLVALSEKRSDIWRRIFEYRFDGQKENNNLGNLILTALTKITGDLPGALDVASELLEAKGKVLPATLDKSDLCAKLSDGRIVVGESAIDKPQHDTNLKIDKVFLEPRAFAYKKTISAINDSDLIVIGPGDLYTSVVPNLLVDGISEAIRNSRAKKIYITNIMTKNGETDNFCAQDFAGVVEKYLGGPLDFVLVNNHEPSPKLLDNYLAEKSFFVKPEFSLPHNYEVVLADLADEEPLAQENGKTRPLIRHDSEKLARAIMNLL